MATRKEIIRSACGVVLRKLELMNNRISVDTAYHLETLRTPETWTFASLAEADAAYLNELTLSEASDLVARRLGR